MDEDIDIVTADGVMNTFVTRPPGDGPHPLVLFLMDAPGKREELHEMARHLAKCGYAVLLPNLYYRSTREFDASDDLDGRLDEVLALIATLDFDTMATDTRALLDHADRDLAIDARSVGVVGYCMSGPFAYAMAGTFPERIRAAASIYGVRLHGPGSPQHRTASIRAQLYFACAELDEYVPSTMVDDLQRHLEATGVDATVERYPGVHHGFAFPSRTGAYDPVAADRHDRRLADLFGRNLGPRPSQNRGPEAGGPGAAERT